jgi:AcrR family transcriptional regulator
MHEVPFPQSGPKRKLLDVAEELFAEKGFEAVSVRDITQAAKANVAAINYHFGSRDGLIAMVVVRHLVPVCEERLARLDAVEKRWAGKTPPLGEIIEAMLRPLLGQLRKSDLSERLFYKLIGRIFAQAGEGVPSSVEGLLVKTNDRFKKSFGKVLPTLSGEDLAWRIHFVSGGMIHMLSNYDSVQKLPAGSSAASAMEVALGRLIRFSAAGMGEGMAVAAELVESPQAFFDF